VSSRLLELAALFARLGTTAFGGPAAHVAMMEEEVVRRRGWLTPDEFLDLLGATNLIPGPSSTELAIHIGHRRAGAAGLVVAGVSFIVPAAAITLAFAWAYVRFGALPRAAGILYGVKPVIVAVVAQALASLGKSAIKSRRLLALGLGALGAVAFGAEELVVLAVTGLTAVIVAGRAPRGPNLVLLGGLASPAPTSIFLVFAKIGSVLFGSGYVLVAFLRTELVEQRHWMTEAQLLDAVAVGQLTPGPVFTTATFAGYVVRGTPGALAATLGIFFPAFVFVALSGRLIPKLRASRAAGAFLDGVNVASLALMAVVTARLAHTALVDVPTVLLGLAAAAALHRKVRSVWLVLAGAAIGLVVPR